ncbi:MAG TPA: cyclic nucleotide-binding domain-containing protein [Methylomirabilota bacterium]
MTASEAARIVRGVLCRGLTHEQTDQIVKAMVPVTAEPGTVVMREGERGHGLLVLLEGTADIVKHDAGQDDVIISTVEAPTVVGEMSLITERPHSATVRARTACEFRLLTRSQFERLLQSENLAAYKVVATLADVIAGRLTRMDEKFAELARRGDGPPMAEELAAFRRKLFSEWTV